MPLIPKLPVKPGYRPQAEDTSIDADVFYFMALRQKPQMWRMERFVTINQSARQLCLSAVQNQNADVPIRVDYVRRRLGQVWCDRVLYPQGGVVFADPITLARKIITILESLGIAYYIGGSVASSVWGESRYTEDLDLVIELTPTNAQPLLEAFLNAAFYITDVAVEDALNRRCSSFNILDNETLEKADLFILENTPFDQIKMERRISYLLPDGTTLWMASPEDIVLQKIVWGKGSQSEKQWRDILGVLKLQAERLDFQYLWHWSTELGIAEALDQAFYEAGL